jgi:NADPH-dependent 2,4-dienoyl-CoA reductase/sulfur reductase-like enzyme
LVSGSPPVVIVGAGPAGMAAAATLAEAGLRPMVLDKFPGPGGQAWRAPAVGGPGPLASLDGEDARRARERFLELARSGRIDWYPETTVIDLTRERLWAVGPSGEVDSTAWSRLVLCPGAIERIVPLPGWTLPGVYTLGGAQTALKGQACALGRRIAFLGTGPLLWLAAAQHVIGGVEVAVVADTARLQDLLVSFPALLADRHRLGLGLRCVRVLRRARVPVLRGVRALAILGEGCVAGVRVTTRRREWSFACDAVATSFGLVPQLQLPDLLDVPIRFDRKSETWLAEVDDAGRTPVPGVYLAGDAAGIRGATAAALTGERAALALLEDLGRSADAERFVRLRKQLHRHARCARALGRAFPLPSALEAEIADDTIVCRCEAVTAGALREAVRAFEVDEVNRAKALTRCGMGRCQGRLCGPTAARVLARAREIDLEAAGRLRTQPPIEPLPAHVRPVEGGSMA